MNKFKILEKDGEFKVQRLVGERQPVYREKAGFYGRATLVCIDEGSDGQWVDWFAWKKVGNCWELCSRKLGFEYNDLFWADRYYEATFDSRDEALNAIQYFYGQQFDLEPAEWRVV